MLGLGEPTVREGNDTMPKRIDPGTEQVVTPEFLRMCGILMYGDRQWMAPLGRSLSNHHPRSNNIASNVVRAWALGERTIPGWVATALSNLLEDHRDKSTYLYELLIDRGSAAFVAKTFDPAGMEDEY
jgi:hypothetical protein